MFFLDLILFGTVGFWLTIVAINIALLCFIEYAKPAWATVTLVLTFAFLRYVKAFDIVAYAPNHVVDILWFLLAYAIIGAIWSFVKWQFFLLENRDAYAKHRKAFLQQNNIKGDAILEELKDKWAGYVISRKIGKPDADDHKETIIMWMTYWPWSILWSLLDDFVKRAFNWIYDQIGKTYDKMADKVYARYDADFKTEK